MKNYTHEDYQLDHVENPYADRPIEFTMWVRKMHELDRITTKLNRLLADPDWDEDEYWALEKKCSGLCRSLGF